MASSVHGNVKDQKRTEARNLRNARIETIMCVHTFASSGPRIQQESRAISGRTARCRCKFRYVSIESYNGIVDLCGFLPQHVFLLVFVCRLR